jgi:hypothetical protein
MGVDKEKNRNPADSVAAENRKMDVRLIRRAGEHHAYLLMVYFRYHDLGVKGPSQHLPT